MLIMKRQCLHGAGGIFIPLAVKTLGLWSPTSQKVLRDIASHRRRNPLNYGGARVCTDSARDNNGNTL